MQRRGTLFSNRSATIEQYAISASSSVFLSSSPLSCRLMSGIVCLQFIYPVASSFGNGDALAHFNRDYYMLIEIPLHRIRWQVVDLITNDSRNRTYHLDFNGMPCFRISVSWETRTINTIKAWREVVGRKFALHHYLFSLLWIKIITSLRHRGSKILKAISSLNGIQT